jgi:hypothetical protein
VNTRRSWKNQDKLFKELFKLPPIEEPNPAKADTIKMCFNCKHFTENGRARAKCKLSGEITVGYSMKECFIERKERDLSV